MKLKFQHFICCLLATRMHFYSFKGEDNYKLKRNKISLLAYYDIRSLEKTVLKC